ncbi:NUDIX domain-containing protein [Nocardioides marmoribigeumensis]|uniref:ADP-ribose pyrophosphatase YjhB (NUDIX family) n=1 Tax=Nocardioides marmoribigeumensis TaxID=433649 RepID=A0ABU2C0X7_9ACTN|nr:NUDIX domain-containing protein [Nocardioides marmoribigeumensis]MDR7364318.1 ADP-ribose pyrophosphatase YjhB (NUDIX family) [Nocardioides marmoribigeumensis]
MSPSPTGRVRPAIKALIVRDGALLVTVNSHWTPLFYLLPGGGQQFGESMREACARECREEVGVDVTVGEVAFVRDYIGSRHEFAAQDSHYHQIEIAFWATLAPGAEPVQGPVGDSFQTGIRWLPLDELDDAPLWPQALKGWLAADPADRPVYLGDVN